MNSSFYAAAQSVPAKVLVDVGPARVNADEANNTNTFIISKGLAARHSSYFSNILSESNTARGVIVCLPQTTSKAFLLWSSWVHLQRLVFPRIGPILGGKSGDREFLLTSWSTLLNSWVLGKSLRDGDFCDAVIDALIDIKNNCQLGPL